MNKLNLKNPYIFKKMYFFKHIFNKHSKYKSKLNLFNNTLNKEKLYSYKNLYFYNSLLLDINKIEKKILVKKSKKILNNRERFKLFFIKNSNIKIISSDIKNNFLINNKKQVMNLSKHLCFDKELFSGVLTKELLPVIKKKYIVKFYVFLGREKNMLILHPYIEMSIKLDIIDQYHMFNFSRLINDHVFILSEYERLKLLYPNKIFIHNSEENLLLINNKRKKIDWNPFYKNIATTSDDNDIIIKCDDDILFIDIYSLKNAIEDRFNDKISFLIHSNCINNGVCTYYQSHLFPKLQNELHVYPCGGILGIIFEKPEISYAIHNQFSGDLLLNIDNLNKYLIDNIYINSRISINFILLNGIDTKYLDTITTDDEYMLSSFIPEKLCRPNKINGNLITSHLSYSFQDKVILNRKDIYNNYLYIKNKFIKLSQPIIINENNNYTKNKIPYVLKCHKINDDIYQILNWYKPYHYYIKSVNNNKYLSIDYENDEFILDCDKKTIFNIYEKNKNIENNRNNFNGSLSLFSATNTENNTIKIKLGIYYFTRYNCISKYRNENIFLKYFNDERERELLKEDFNEMNNSFLLKFIKYNCYFGINEKNTNLIDVTMNKNYRWTFEKVKNNNKYINCTRFIKNNKFYYKNIETNEIYTNYYMGWGLENVLY